MATTQHVLTDFEKDVQQGLSSSPKFLSSRFLYDNTGNGLFQQIMDLPEYYLTRLEHRILKQNKQEIIELFNKEKKTFDLIDLGAGDAKKTKILLKELLEQKIKFRYVPIDISHPSIEDLSENLLRELPGLELAPRVGTYHEVLKTMKTEQATRRVFLLLGSNIGNLIHKRAVDLLSAIKQTMRDKDLLFAGFDQKKDPVTILTAYNDSLGVTESFNKNLLVRINNELDGNFDPDTFLHWPLYNPETGTVKSYLVSKKAQKININSLSLEVSFRAWESIHVEIAQKYDDQIVQSLALDAGLEIADQIGDKEGLFKNYIFKRRGA